MAGIEEAESAKILKVFKYVGVTMVILVQSYEYSPTGGQRETEI
jgi:hypothetical protein